jgi:hypothetical protein
MRREKVGPRRRLPLILRLPLPSYVPWIVIAAVGAGTVLSYAILAEYFPKEVAGRANAALNLFHIGGAFVVQYLTGLVVRLWAPTDGHYRLPNRVCLQRRSSDRNWALLCSTLGPDATRPQ